MGIVPAPADRILTVSELTRRIKDTLESGYSQLWVKGELSGLKRPDSGHLYFSLKEGTHAVLSCAMFRREARTLGFEPREGDEVEAFGDVSVFEARGIYQLVVRQMRPAGIGALLVQLEELKRRLAAEGLFDTARKRPLPTYPHRVGVVTSPVGAAVHDVVKVMRSRWPAIEIVLAPVKVQGAGAAEEIAAAIDRFNRYGRVDVLIVGRGGGSIEDLWAFNEETVVRALARSQIPTVSAVGHESDTTLSDLAADVRAATPSNAAELVVPDRRQAEHRVGVLADRLRRAVRQGLETRRRSLARLVEQYGFRRLSDALGMWQQRIDNGTARMRHALRHRVGAARERLRVAAGSYMLREWRRALAARGEGIQSLRERIGAALVRDVHERRRRLQAYADRLRALSPRLVLERGFCLARAADGTVLRSAEALRIDDRVTLEFARGEADARIEAVRPGGEDGS